MKWSKIQPQKGQNIPQIVIISNKIIHMTTLKIHTQIPLGWTYRLYCWCQLDDWIHNQGKETKESKNQTFSAGVALTNFEHLYSNAKSIFVLVKGSSSKTLRESSLLFPIFGVQPLIILNLLSMRPKLTKILTSWKTSQLLFRSSPTYLGHTHQKMVIRMLLLQFLFQMMARPLTTLSNLPSFKTGSIGMTEHAEKW